MFGNAARALSKEPLIFKDLSFRKFEIKAVPNDPNVVLESEKLANKANPLLPFPVSGKRWDLIKLGQFVPPAEESTTKTKGQLN